MTSYPTLLGTGGHNTDDQNYNGVTYFSNIGLGRCAMETNPKATESLVSQTIRASGDISYLSWGVQLSGFGAALTLSLRINLNLSALAVNIPSNTTGIFTDNSHIVSVSSGDVLDFGTHVSAPVMRYDGSFNCVTARFDASTDTTQMLATVGRADFSPVFSRQYVNFLGVLGNGNGTAEWQQQFLCSATGTWQYMACHIETNGVDQTTIINNRINSNNGSMQISIPAYTSGSFEDTGDSDDVIEGNYLDYAFLSDFGSVSGSLTIDWLGAHFSPTENLALCMIGGSAEPFYRIVYGGEMIPSIYYTSLFGGGNPGSDVNRATGLIPYALKASQLTILIAGFNDAATYATATVLQNGSTTALSIMSIEDSTGFFTDPTDTVDFAVGDCCANIIQGNGVAPITWVVWASGTMLVEAL